MRGMLLVRVLCMLTVLVPDTVNTQVVTSKNDYFITEKESKSFMQHSRWRRQVDCAAEGACERNKEACTQESDREKYCQTSACSSGQTCYLATPCPGHFETGCTDNACKGLPCNNGGTCTDTTAGYTCKCIPGYQGDNCEDNKDECASNPCQNGATCHDSVNRYTCACKNGYVGSNCQTDKDECASNPCQNGATCHDSVNRYTCSCKDGYEGSNCETDTNECASNPCQNGATCHDHVNSYTCTCAEDYTGTNCEIDMCIPQFPSGGDVVFLIDASMGQTLSNFEKAKQYVKEFVSNFPIGPSDFQIALVTSSFDATVQFYLKNLTTSVSIQKAIDSVNYEQGPSYTGKGLQAIREHVFTSINGARTGVQQYAIVLTDGLSSDRLDTILQVNFLKEAGVHLISIAIGRQINHQELIHIASHWNRVFPSSSKDAVNAILKAHVMTDCPDCYHSTSDVAIMIDASSDSTLVQYYKQIAAVVVLVNNMPIDTDGVHVSCSQYGEDVTEEFRFNEYMTSSPDAIIRLNSMRQQLSAANVTHALKHLRQWGYQKSSGARSETRKVAILVTSGIFTNENHEELMTEAELLRNTDTIVIVVGIGVSANMTSLLNIASDPAYTFVIADEVYIDNDVLNSLIGSLDFDICDMD